jgi:hypothetical protein
MFRECVNRRQVSPQCRYQAGFCSCNVLYGVKNLLRRALFIVLGTFKFHEVSESGFVTINIVRDR